MPIDVEQVPLNGLELRDIAELDIEAVGGCVWVHLRRRDGTIVRIWISRPDVERSSLPLKISVEAE